MSAGYATALAESVVAGSTWSGTLDYDPVSTAKPVPGAAEARYMPQTLETRQIEEALDAIDRVLGDLTRRELVSSTEVTDLLLDVRSILTGTMVEPVGVH